MTLQRSFYGGPPFRTRAAPTADGKNPLPRISFDVKTKPELKAAARVVDMKDGQ